MYEIIWKCELINSLAFLKFFCVFLELLVPLCFNFVGVRLKKTSFYTFGSRTWYHKLKTITGLMTSKMCQSQPFCVTGDATQKLIA